MLTSLQKKSFLLSISFFSLLASLSAGAMDGDGDGDGDGDSAASSSPRAIAASAAAAAAGDSNTLRQETGPAATLMGRNAASSSDPVDVMREEVEREAQRFMTVRSSSDPLNLGLTWLDFNEWSKQVFRLSLASDPKAPAAMDLLMHHVQNKQHPHQQEGLRKTNDILDFPAVKTALGNERLENCKDRLFMIARFQGHWELFEGFTQKAITQQKKEIQRLPDDSPQKEAQEKALYAFCDRWSRKGSKEALLWLQAHDNENLSQLFNRGNTRQRVIISTLKGYLAKYPPALVYDALKAFYAQSPTGVPLTVEGFFGNYDITDALIKIQSWGKLADQGEATAQYNLGLMHKQGLGELEQDEKKERELYEKAAAQGYVYAQHNLGVMYMEGRGGLQKNEAKARELYEKAAAQGNAAAQCNLGVMYDGGQGGLQKNVVKARALYEQAAAQGEAAAQFNLGIMHEQGLGGLQKNEVKARELYEKAAAQGDPNAQNNLGVLYADGRGGLPKDEKKARALYEQAAAQGNAAAQYNLGIRYAYGRGGLPKDDVAARELFEKALAAGLTEAKYGIADLLLQKGENLSLAYAYLQDVMAEVPNMKGLAAEKLQFLKDLQSMQEEEAAEKYAALQKKEQAQMKMGGTIGEPLTHDQSESAQEDQRGEDATAAAAASGAATPAYGAIPSDTHADEETSSASSEREEEQTASEGEEAQTPSFASGASGATSAAAQLLSTSSQKRPHYLRQSKANKELTKREKTLAAVQKLREAQERRNQEVSQAQREYAQTPRTPFFPEELEMLRAIFGNKKDAAQQAKEIRRLLASSYFFPGEVEYKETSSGFVIVFHNHQTGVSRSAGSHRAHKGGNRIDGSLDLGFIRDLREVLDDVYKIGTLIREEAV